MPLYEFEGKRPKISSTAFISDSAVVIGDVEIGEKCYIASNCVIRGDWGKIIIGNETNIQDGCIIHVRPDEQTLIGKRASIGHGSIIHNCTIEDFALVGMNAVISDWAVVGEYSVIAEGCVVRHNQEIPPKSIAVGIPAKVIGSLTNEQIEKYDGYKTFYADLSGRCHASLKKIDA